MANQNDRNDHRHDAATDPRAAAQQEQVKRDHDALEAQARRVEATAPSGDAATDPHAAAVQDQIKADHDAIQESARRVEASVSQDVRDTPIERANVNRDERRR